MEDLHKLKAHSYINLIMLKQYTKMKVGLPFLVLFGLGFFFVGGEFFSKHFTNVPYYLPGFTKAMLSLLFWIWGVLWESVWGDGNNKIY